MKDDAKIKWHYAANDGLKGSRIVLRSRKLGKAFVVHGSHTHRAAQICGSDNCEAWIEIPLRPVVEAKPRG